MTVAAQFPRKGQQAVFCEHLSNGGEWPLLRGSYVLRMLPDQMLAPGELEHDWLFLCYPCREVKRLDPAAAIKGFRWTLQKDLPPGQLLLLGVTS